MADEAEIDITILPEEDVNLEAAEKQDEPKKVIADDPAKADLKSQFAELEQRAETERTARLAAERASAQHQREAEESKRRETGSHLDVITTSINSAQQEVDSAKSAYIAAREAGDYRAEADANDRLAIARADIRRLDEAKQDIEYRVKQPRREVQAPVDAVEVFAQGRTAPTANWVRAHPDYVRTEKGLRKLTAADAVAQDEGFLPDTSEYFERVEQYLGIRQSPTAATATAKVRAAEEAPTEAVHIPPAKPRSAAPPVAPAASVSGGSSQSDKSVTLTRREADSAVDGTHVWNYDDPTGQKRWKKGDVWGTQEYARRKRDGMRRGLYDRTYTES